MASPETLRELLCALGNYVRDKVLAARDASTSEKLSEIAHVCTSDTIYAIDRVSEDSIAQWFTAHWPQQEPVQVVMEGIEDDDPLCFPAGVTVAETKWKCLLDPIDGTRCIMHDKRSAWVLAGIAPQKGDDTRLSDIVAAAMTELPITKQWRSDQFSATLGGGVTANATNVLDGSTLPLTAAPSQAVDFRHGFSWVAKYFPEGRTLTSQIEELFWEEVCEPKPDESLAIFDDQYLSTGGAFYEFLAGHDRMGADLRPLVFDRLGLDSPMVCHPYDVSAALILQEAGVIYEHPLGGFPDAPLDTTTPITWVTWANSTLADKARPKLRQVLGQILG